MSDRTLNECPACLRFPCECGGDVANNAKETEIFAEKKWF